MGAFLTIREACDAFRVGRTTLYRIIKSGRLPVLKIGRATRIRVSDLERWVASLSTSKNGGQQ